MADGVNIPAQGAGDTTPKVSTQKVTADTSDVQDVSLTSVVGGVRTRNPTIPVSDAGGSLTVDAPAATPVAVRFSDGATLQTPVRVDNQAFVDNSSNVTPVAFIFDEVAGTALTEDDAAAGRIDSKRAQIGVIEDATTRGQRAAVSAANALKVDGSAVTQPVDTELPAAAALTDTDANPTTSTVAAANMGWTGSVWQRLKSGPNSDGIGANGFLNVLAMLFNGTTYDRIRGDAANGVDVDVTRLQNPIQSATATLTNVASSATNVTLKASNAARKGLVIVNDSTSILYVKFGATASTTSYSYFLAGSVNGVPSTLELPLVVYTGIVDGIWSSAVGNARVTELT